MKCYSVTVKSCLLKWHRWNYKVHAKQNKSEREKLMLNNLDIKNKRKGINNFNPNPNLTNEFKPQNPDCHIVCMCVHLSMHMWWGDVCVEQLRGVDIQEMKVKITKK